MSVRFVADVVGVADINAGRLVGDIEKLGLLKEITGKKRNRLFSYDPYLALFGDEPSDEREA